MNVFLQNAFIPFTIWQLGSVKFIFIFGQGNSSLKHVSLKIVWYVTIQYFIN